MWQQTGKGLGKHNHWAHKKDVKVCGHKLEVSRDAAFCWKELVILLVCPQPIYIESIAILQPDWNHNKGNLHIITAF